MNKRLKSDIDSIKAVVRDAGLRATPARIATLKLLWNTNAPLTHAEVVERLHDFGADKATVFRNLNDMVSVGLLRRAELGDHVWRFEAIFGGKSHESVHPHFVCVDCGGVSCMDEVKLTAGSVRMSKEFGEVKEILLRGQCNNCL